MKKYIETIKIYLKRQAIWRTDTIIQILMAVTQIIFAYLLWGIIFKQRDTVGGFTFQAMLSYYIFSTFFTQLDLSARISEDMSNRIRSGTMSNFLVIPVNVRRYYMSMVMGMSLYYFIFDIIVTGLWVVIFQVKLAIADNILTIMAAISIELLALYFMMLLNYYIGLLTIKYEEIGTFLMIKNNLMSLVTGSIIPLILFPEIVVKIMKLLPFYYVTYLPAMLMTGRCGDEMIVGIVVIFSWIVVMHLLIHMNWQKYRLRYDGVGI